MNRRAAGAIPVRVIENVDITASPLKPITRYDVCVKNPACSGNEIKLRDYYFKHFSVDTDNQKEEKKMIARLLDHVKEQGFKLSDIVRLELPERINAKIIYV